MTEPAYITAKEAGRKYGVSAATIRRWAASGHLPVFRSPTGAIRFPVEELDAWFRSLTTAGNAPPAAEVAPGRTRGAAEWQG